MIESVPFQIFSLSIGMISFLSAVIFRDFRGRLIKVENEQNTCPFPGIQQDIAAMKQDIQWLKNYLIHK